MAIDFFPVVFAWIILPAQFDAPIDAVALVVPDVFAVILLLTVLCIGWAMARIFLTLRPRRLMSYATG